MELVQVAQAALALFCGTWAITGIVMLVLIIRAPDGREVPGRGFRYD